jgi:hypothetical protein
LTVALTVAPVSASLDEPAALEEEVLESLLHATDAIASTATSAKNARRV